MLKPLVAYLTTAVSFMALDAVWLSQMGPRLYRPVLGDMIATSVRIGPAVAFYAIYIFGLVYFAVLPGIEAGRWSKAALNAAVMAVVAYATYDLTNQATLKTWSTTLTLADLAWGAFASTAACSVAYAVAKRVG